MNKAKMLEHYKYLLLKYEELQGMFENTREMTIPEMHRFNEDFAYYREIGKEMEEDIYDE